MIVRCRKAGPEAEAFRALLRIRMRMASLCDWNYYWQNPHPGNPKTSPDSVRKWLDDQWKMASKLDRNCLIGPEEADAWDRDVCTFQLWFIEDWPTDKIVGKRVNTDGTFASHPNWVARLHASIKKHGIIDPILAWNHVPSQQIIGKPSNTPNVVLGNNRIAIAQHYGIPTIPLVVSLPKGSTPQYGKQHKQITPETLHNECVSHRADLWLTPEDWYLVHPPSVFYDEKDGGTHLPSPL